MKARKVLITVSVNGLYPDEPGYDNYAVPAVVYENGSATVDYAEWEESLESINDFVPPGDDAIESVQPVGEVFEV